MFRPKRALRNIRRFIFIAVVVSKNGVRFLMAETDTHRFIPFKESKTGPEILLETFEDLGTTFIKFGQLMAERPDIVPRRFTDELEGLKDDVPTFDSQTAVRIVDDEVGMENFEYVEEDPLGSASIAQVHKAKLDNGDDVVVKVRRPGIKKTVNTDLRILVYLARKAERVSTKLSNMRASTFVEEFAAWTREELDMEKEASNIEIFRDNVEERGEVKVPETYPELYTEKVLVMEFIDGVEATDTDQLDEWDVDREQVAETIIESGMKQVLWDGFFHADIHSSNFMVDEDGEVAFIDFGMMGEIDGEAAEKLGILIIYFMRENTQGVKNILKDLGIVTDRYQEHKVEQAVVKRVLTAKHKPKEDQSLTVEVLNLFIDVADYGIYMPSTYTLIIKDFITLEGLGTTLHPDFKITDTYHDTIEEILIKDNLPKELGKDLAFDFLANKDMITRLPQKINNKLDEFGEKAEEGVRVNSGIVPATLIGGSTLVLAMNGALSQTNLMYLAAAELVAGLLLLRKM
jgi:ubiquinone biosynthesis protein